MRRIFRKTLAAAGLSLAASAAAAEKNFEMFTPDDAKRFVETYKAAPIVRAGDFLYISGVVAGLRPDDEPTPDAYEAAMRVAFERIGRALGAAGASWDNVVEMTTFHVGMRDHQEIAVGVREDFVGEAPYPTWTAIGVEKLWADDLFLEIRVTAYLGE
ncbi:MAG: Rid family hydrolase [Parvularculaceae bacterium]